MMNGLTSPAPTSSAAPVGPLPGARLALLLLISINLFNYIDRQVLAAVEPDIRGELLAGDSEEVARVKTGMLSTAFLVTYMFLAPLFGWLADRMGRWHLVGIGVILWSLASGASGWRWGVDEGAPSLTLWGGLVLTKAFVLLLLTRCFVGVGEAAYGPVAPTVISDLYPVQIRGTVIAWFYAAIPVGGALGYALGGQVASSALGWRWAFFLVVPPGLLLGLWSFFMPDPPRGQADAGPLAGGRRAGLKEYLGLLSIPSYVLNTLGMTAMTFAMGGLAYWMPDYLKARHVEGLLGTDARTTFGALTALSGLIATILGGIAGDRLRPHFAGSYFLVSGIAMMIGFPMILLVLWTPFPVAWVFIFLAVFCLFFNTGPTNTILANVTHPAVRASGFAFNILIIHLFGDAVSPPIIGYISGRSGSNDLGFMVVSAMMLVGGVLWLWGMRYLARDTALAPTRLDRT
jgi:MFS family permease